MSDAAINLNPRPAAIEMALRQHLKLCQRLDTLLNSPIILFLVSEVSRYVTATDLIIDGGLVV